MAVAAFAAQAQDAFCNDHLVCFDLVAVQQAEQADVAIEILQFVSCVPTYDLTQLDEPIISYTVKVNPLKENDPRLINYYTEADGNEKILVNEKWVKFTTFTNTLLPADCNAATS